MKGQTAMTEMGDTVIHDMKQYNKDLKLDSTKYTAAFFHHEIDLSYMH